MGIICACALALPAFIDRYWPRHNISSFFFKISSYFSSLSGDGTGKSASGSGQSSRNTATYATSSSEQNAGHLKHEGWSRLDQEHFAEETLRPDLDTLMMTHTTVGYGSREEDLEEWGQAGIVKKVDLTQSYPMTGHRP